MQRRIKKIMRLVNALLKYKESCFHVKYKISLSYLGRYYVVSFGGPVQHEGIELSAVTVIKITFFIRIFKLPLPCHKVSHNFRGIFDL